MTGLLTLSKYHRADGTRMGNRAEWPDAHDDDPPIKVKPCLEKSRGALVKYFT
jgi:hypothetical protein